MYIESSIQIALPAREVFEFLADYSNDPSWRAGVRVMRADGPVAVGTTTYEELTFLGSTYVTHGIVTERTPTRLAFRGENASVSSEGFREVASAGDETRVTYALRLEPRGALQLFSWMLRPIHARRIDADLARLMTLLEAADVPSTAATAEPAR